jgi:hypothetical protein
MSARIAGFLTGKNVNSIANYCNRFQKNSGIRLNARVALLKINLKRLM